MKQAIPYIRAFIFISLFLSLIYGGFDLVFSTIFKIAGVPPIAVRQTTIIYADDGSILSREFTEENRYWISLTNMNHSIIDATLATEDQHFYDHNGFDYTRIAGAIVADIKAMKKVQGASTVTQQLARNLYLEHEKTWTRKFKEALYTIRLEQNLSKQQILESYLNTIYYGFGAYGIEAASKTYYGKSAKDLTIAESALLAGIPKNPSIFSPFMNEKNALKRQQLILKQMYSQNRLSTTAYKQALKENITFASKEDDKQNSVAPYFTDTVKQHLKSETNLTTKQIIQGGLRVYTTLNPTIQQNIEAAIAREVPTNSTIQTAVFVQNPLTGEVKGLVGGRNYKNSQFNRVTQAVRQPGSTIKPLLYYTALENGFTPSTSLRSEKTALKIEEGDVYAPNNASHTYANRKITMLEALALSDNIYAIKTLQTIGEKEFIHTAKAFSLQTKIEEVPSLALGTSPVKPIELINAYGMIANGGKKIEPTFITRVEDVNGNVLYERKGERKQLLDNSTTFILANLMKGMFEKDISSYTTVTGTDIADEITHAYSGKSGSTKTDSWMIGFTPELITGVWVGYDENKPLTSVQEYRYSKRIWLDTMEHTLLKIKNKEEAPPSDVIGIKIDPHTGKIASSSCPLSRVVYYKKGTEPTEICTDHSSSKEKKKDGKMPTKKSWIGSLF